MTRRLRPEERKIGFWPKVRKLPDAGELGGCWEWTGSRTRFGYGISTLRGIGMVVHRISWIMANGAIPEGLLVLHKCDNPPCVRPGHLFLGTYQDNSDDMKAKGRAPTGAKNGSHTHPERRPWGDRSGSRLHPETRPRGDAHWLRKHPERMRGMLNPHAVLSDEAIQEIRTLYRGGGYRQADLAIRFNVSQTHICRIVNGKQRVE